MVSCSVINHHCKPINHIRLSTQHQKELFDQKHTLSFSGDTITLTVETTEVPEEIQRKVSQSENHKINIKGGYKFKA